MKNEYGILSESGMKLYAPAEETFYVEQYVRDNAIEHVRAVECIRRKNNKLLFLVEAKTSAPNPQNQDDFTDFIAEIHQKAIDSFSLLMSILLGRREVPLPEHLGNVQSADFSLVLIIKNHQAEWLPPVQDALRERLRHFTTAWKWGSQPVLVLNEGLAAKHGLVAGDGH